MIGAAESFKDWSKLAFDRLADSNVSLLSNVKQLMEIYQLAAQYNPSNVTAKTALEGISLYNAMAEFVWPMKGYRVIGQMNAPPEKWPNISNDIGTFAQYYGEYAGFLRFGSLLNKPDAPKYADVLTANYLHVFEPDALRLKGGMRIAVNVQPAGMAAATASLVPLLDRKDIYEIKFLAPGLASKADSVVVYAVRDAVIEELCEAVLKAAEDLPVQKRVGAGYEEIADGIGVAGEPPVSSFTQYRCIVFKLAYDSYVFKNGEMAFDKFWLFFKDYMSVFGIDPDNPHLQGKRLENHKKYKSRWQSLEILAKEWK